MAIAAGLEIDACKGSTPSQGNVLGVAQGTRLTGAVTRNLSSPMASAAESFRSGWQSLLASLGSSVEDSSQTGSEAGQGSTVLDLAQGETAGMPPVSTSTKSARADSLSSQETEKGSGKTNAAVKSPTGDARAEGLATRLPAATIPAASSRTKGRKPAADSKTESASSACSTDFAHVAAPAVVSTGSRSEVAPETNASLSLATSSSAIINTVSYEAVKLTQRTETDLSTEMSGGFTSASFSWHSTDSERPMPETERANAGGQTAVGEAEASANQTQVSPASSLSESSGPIFKQTGISAVDESATRPVAMPVADRGVPELSASGLNRSQAAEPNRNRPQTAMQGQESTETRTASQSSSLNLVSGAGATDTAVSSQGSVQARAASGSQVQVIAQSRTKAPTPPLDKVANSAPSINSDGLGPLSVATDTTASQPGRLTVPSVVDDPGYAGSGRASVPGRSRSMHGTGNVNSIQPRNRLLEGQASSPDADASAMAHEVANASGSVRTPGASVEVSTAATSGPDSRDTFALLDAGGREGRPTWIHAGTQRAEAGFQDPTLGWVGIRANANGGGVHAELVPGSADAAQALGSHLAGLNAYLAEHHTPVETLTLTAPGSGWTGLGSEQGAGHGMQQGTGQQAGQGLAQGTDSGSQFGESRSPTSLPAVASGSTALPAELDGSAQPVWLGGEHISVMA
jgi:hypothetical protein